jgi:hypothetical protein
MGSRYCLQFICIQYILSWILPANQKRRNAGQYLSMSTSRKPPPPGLDYVLKQGEGERCRVMGPQHVPIHRIIKKIYYRRRITAIFRGSELPSFTTSLLRLLCVIGYRLQLYSYMLCMYIIGIQNREENSGESFAMLILLGWFSS